MNINNQFEEVFKEELDAKEFVRGQQDCIDGVSHKDRNLHSSYSRGYAAQYQLEQAFTGMQSHH